jgi:metal-sulfur cluster biosynthetic enzyme
VLPVYDCEHGRLTPLVSRLLVIRIPYSDTVEGIRARIPGKKTVMIISKEEELIESLRSVIDPEIGLNIVELGLVRNIELDEPKEATTITMILTTPFCPYGPQLIEQVRQVGRQTMGGNVTVEIGTELWDPSMMEEGAGGDWGLF